MTIYKSQAHSLGAEVYNKCCGEGQHPIMTDEEWEAQVAAVEAAKEQHYSIEAMAERIRKGTRSMDEMKAEWDNKNGLVGRDNYYLPEGVTQGWNRDIHGMGVIIN